MGVEVGEALSNSVCASIRAEGKPPPLKYYRNVYWIYRDGFRNFQKKGAGGGG